jgi:hypothetical protein
VTEADENHVSAQLQGGDSGGRKKVHIYLEGVGRGPGGYDNVWVKGEGVMVKKGRRTVLDPSLSSGTYPAMGGLTSGTAGYGGESSWSGQQQQQQQQQPQPPPEGQSEWIWHNTYNRWYHPGTGQWH